MIKSPAVEGSYCSVVRPVKGNRLGPDIARLGTPQATVGLHPLWPIDGWCCAGAERKEVPFRGCTMLGTMSTAHRHWQLLAQQLGLWGLCLPYSACLQWPRAAWAAREPARRGTLPLRSRPLRHSMPSCFPCVVRSRNMIAAIERLRASLGSVRCRADWPSLRSLPQRPRAGAPKGLLWEVGYRIRTGREPSGHSNEVVRGAAGGFLAPARPYSESARSSPALFEWLAKNGYYANGDSFAFWSVASTP